MNADTAIEEARPILSIGVGRFSLSDDQRDPHFNVKRGSEKYARCMEVFGEACFYCGVRSPGWLQIHHLDDDHKNDDESNLRPICPFCHSTKHMEMANIKGSGLIVYWPEIPQEYFSRFMRGLFVSVMRNCPEMKEMGSRIGASLAKRAAIVEKSWGTSDPVEFAKAFQELGFLSYSDMKDKCSDLRFICTMKSPLISREYIQALCKEAEEVDPLFNKHDQLMFGLLGPDNG